MNIGSGAVTNSRFYTVPSHRCIGSRVSSGAVYTGIPVKKKEIEFQGFFVQEIPASTPISNNNDIPLKQILEYAGENNSEYQHLP